MPIRQFKRATKTVHKPRGSRWAQAFAFRLEELEQRLAPSNNTFAAVGLAGQPETLFAITSDHALYRHLDAAGWQKIGGSGTILSISGAAETSGNAVLFVVTTDHALFRLDSRAGWSQLGGSGTIQSISAGTDRSGRADVFVLTALGDFLEFSSAGWQQIGGRGTILQMSAVGQGRVFVTTTDHSIFGHDDTFGWYPETGPGFAQSLSAVDQATGGSVIFAVTQDNALFRHQDGGAWAKIGGSGSVQLISAGTDAAGQASVFVITTLKDFDEFSSAGWQQIGGRGSIQYMSGAAGDLVYAISADGTIFGHSGRFGWFPETGPGFGFVDTGTQSLSLNISGPSAGELTNTNVTVTGQVTGGTGGVATLQAQIDNGAFFNVSFDAAGNFSFPTSFALDGTADGGHVIQVQATDHSGNVANALTSLTLDTKPQIISVEPVDSSQDVLPTQFVTITLSKPVQIKPPAGVTTPAVTVSAQGAALPGEIVVDHTGTRIMFLPTGSLPTGVAVTVTIDPSQIVDANGNPLEGPQQEFTTHFMTVASASVPGTTVTGVVYDSKADVNGNNVPVVGAHVILANDPSNQTTTDSQGRFQLSNTPAGKLLIQVDGHTAQSPSGTFYPEVAELIDAVPGQTTRFKAPIFLPLAPNSAFVTLSSSNTTAVTNSAQLPGWTLMVPPNATMRRDGTFGQQMLLGAVPPDRLPAPLPPGMNPPLVITIQTQGGADVFLQPVPLTAPNLEHLPPGSQTVLWDFDHARGQFVPVATATVSADGQTVTTDPGQGIIRPGWHFFLRLVTGNTRGGDFNGTKQNGQPLSDAQKDEAAKLLNDMLLSAAKAAAELASALSRLGGLPGFALGIGLDLVGEEINKAREATGTEFKGNPLDDLAQGMKDNGVDLTKIAMGGEITAGQLDAFKNGFNDLGQQMVNAANDLRLKGDPNFNPEVFDKALENVKGLAEGLHSVAGVIDKAVKIKNFIDFLGDSYRALKDLMNLLKLLQDPPGDKTAELMAQLHQTSSQIAQGVAGFTQTLGNAYQIFSDEMAMAKAAMSLPSTEAQVTDAQRAGILAAANDEMVQFDAVQNNAAQTLSGLQAAVDAAQALPGQALPASPNRLFYKVTSASGAVQRGSAVEGASFSFGTTAGATGITITVADPISGLIGQSVVSAPTPDQGMTSFSLPPIALFPSSAASTSGNGLPDDISAVLADTPPSKLVVDDLLAGIDPAAAGLVANGVIGRVASPGVDVAAGNGVAYVAAGSAGLQVVDLTRPSVPLIVGRAATQQPAQRVFARDAFVAVTEQNGVVEVFDASQPSNPQLLQTLTGLNGLHAVLGPSTVIVNNGVNLRSFDIVTGLQLGQLNLPGSGNVEDLYLSNGVVFAILHDAGAQRFTLDSVAIDADGTLSPIGSVSFSGVEPVSDSAHISGGDGVLYISGISTDVHNFNPGFATINIADPANMSMIAGTTPDAVFDMAEDGSRLALASTRVGGPPVVAVFDVSDSTKTGNLAASFPVPQQVQAVAVAGGLGLAVDGSSLLVVRFAQSDNGTIAPTVSISVPAGTNQVIAGQTVPVHVKASDDFQIAHVDLLVQGNNQVGTDNSFPYDGDFIVPAGIPAGTVFTLTARAVDTAGTVMLSNPITLTVIADTTAPAVINSSPVANGIGLNIPSITLTFNKAINPVLVAQTGIHLINLGPDGVVDSTDDTSVALASVQLRAGNRQMVVTPQVPLPRGKYQLTVDASVIADFSGNQMAAPFTLTFTSEDVPATVFWAKDGNGNWNDPSNWSTGVVPGANDVVLIDRFGASPTVTISGGNFTVKGIVSRTPLVLSGGSLTVTSGASRTEGPLTVSNGASLAVNGSGASFSALGATTIDGGQVFASGGGVLNLPTVTSYTGANFTTLIHADGAASKINLPNLTTLNGGTGGAVVQVQVTGGGAIDLHSLPHTIAGAVQFRAFDAGSVIDLSALTNFSATTGNASLEAHGGATVKVPNLVTLDSLAVFVGSALMPVAQISSLTNSSITAGDGATATFSGLATFTNDSFFASGGGVLNLPTVTSYTGANFTTLIHADGAGSKINLPNLTTLNGGTGGAVVQVQVTGGGAIDMRSLPHMIAGAVQFRAFDANSTIDLSALTNFTATTGNASLEAHGGATVKVPNLVTLDSLAVFVGSALMPVAQISSLTNSSITAGDGATATFSGLATFTSDSFFASGGGVLNLPTVTSYTGASFTTLIHADGAGSKIDLSNLTTLNGGTGGAVVQVQVTGGGAIDMHSLPHMIAGAVQFRAFDANSMIDLSALTNFSATTGNASLEAHGGTTVKVPNLVTLDSVSVFVGSALMPVAQISSMTNSSITVGDGATATLSSLTTFTNDSFFASASGVLNLPTVTSYTGAGFTTLIHADGAGSKVNLSNLTTLNGGTGGAVVQVQVTGGGAIDLHSLPQMTSGAVQFRAFDAGSVIDLSALTNFSATTGNASLEAHGGAMVKVSNLTTTSGFGVVLDGSTSTLSTSQFTNINTLGFFAQNGGVIDLTGVTSYTGNNFTTSLQADGVNSQINLSKLTTLVGGTNGAVVDFVATSGGLVDLHMLPQLTSGAARFRAFGTNSLIDVSALTNFSPSTSNSSIEAHGGATVKEPLLTTTSNFGLILDGAASHINTSQFTSINTLGFFAQNGGVIDLTGVTSYPGNNFTTTLQADGVNSQINLSKLTTLVGGNNGAVVDFVATSGGLVDLHMLSQLTSGAARFRAFGTNSLIDVSALTNFSPSTSNSSIEAHGGATVKVPLLTTTSNFGLILDGAASHINTSQFTSINTLGFLAQNGGVIDLTGVTSYTGNNFTTNFQADGTSSQINLSKLTTLVGGNGGAVVDFLATSGGSIDLHMLSQLTSGAARFRAFGTSVVDVSALTNFSPSTSNSSIEAHGGGTVKVPLLTTTSNFGLIVDGAASHINTSQFTTINTLGFFAQNGGVIDLTGVTSYTGNNFTTNFQADGAGSQINLSKLTTLVGGNNGAVVDFLATSGGLVDLHMLPQITSGAARFRAYDTSVIDLSGLTSFSPTASNSDIEVHGTATVHLDAGTTTLTSVPVYLFDAGMVSVGTVVLGSGAVLSGNGTVTGNVTNGGVVTPGGPGAAGTITITGNYVQTSGGALNIDVGGLNAGTQFDQLKITGSATLAGTLNLARINGFAASIGNTFKILVFGSRSGQFDTVNGTDAGNGHLFVVQYDPTDMTLSVS